MAKRDPSLFSDGDSVAAIARDILGRLNWDAGAGVAGYPKMEPANVGGRDEGLARLRQEIGDCKRCPLCRERTNIVFGEGASGADLVFVGEGPGRDEDASGRPFVGAAGQLLDRIIEAMGLTREGVYICNVVKCRPPKNRVPETEECAVCGPFLVEQLRIIGPSAIVALGSTAARFLLERDAPISSLRGAFHDGRGFKIMPTYHPAYLLRNPDAKRLVWQDMQKVQGELGLTGPASKSK